MQEDYDDSSNTENKFRTPIPVQPVGQSCGPKQLKQAAVMSVYVQTSHKRHGKPYLRLSTV